MSEQPDLRRGPGEAPAASATSLLAAVEQYWREAGAGEIPFRTRIDPARLGAGIGHAMILERVAPGIGRIRVAGRILSDWTGAEPRGMPLSALFAPEMRDLLADCLSLLWDGPALVEVPVVSPRGIGRPRLSGRMLLLPLRDGRGAVARALGAMLVDGRAGRAPRSFAIDPAARIRIEPLDPPATAPGPDPEPEAVPAAHGLRLVVNRARPAFRPLAPGRPALRLVD